MEALTQIPRRRGPQRVNYRWEAIADLMLSSPHLKQGEIAARLGYTQSWVSQIMNSDAFRDYYNRRREGLNEDIDDAISTTLADLARVATEKSIKRIQDGNASEDFLTSARDSALSRMGYGTAQRTDHNININNPAQAAWQRRLEQLRGETPADIEEAEFTAVLTSAEDDDAAEIREEQADDQQ